MKQYFLLDDQTGIVLLNVLLEKYILPKYLMVTKSDIFTHLKLENFAIKNHWLINYSEIKYTSLLARSIKKSNFYSRHF